MTGGRNQGFTLIELILTIVLAGLVATMVATVIGNQASGYVDLQQRARLVQLADSAIQQITKDIRNAVPNSIRVSGNYLEFVPVQMMGYYRSELNNSGGLPGDILDFTVEDTEFSVYEDLYTGAGVGKYYPSAQVVIYNLGSPGADLYNDAIVSGVSSGVISEPGLYIKNAITKDYADGFLDGVIDGNPDTYPEDIVCFDQDDTNCGLPVGQQFSSASPTERMYIVDGAQTYQCAANAANPSAGLLSSYSGYAIQSIQPTTTGAPLNTVDQVIVTDSVSSCSFSYNAGMAQESIVSIHLTLSDGNNQSISLMKQVKVSNVP